jgi:hypothetical protein
MNKSDVRYCLRCKSEMIISETSEDMVGFSMVITKQFICPDPECQKVGDKGIAQEKEKTQKREQLRQESKQRAIDNRAKTASLKKEAANK